MATLALILSLIGLLSSFLLVGIFPSLAGMVFSLLAMIRKVTRTAILSLILGLLGIILSILFYLNTYGFASPSAVLNGTAQPLETPLIFHKAPEEEEAAGEGSGATAAGSLGEATGAAQGTGTGETSGQEAAPNGVPSEAGGEQGTSPQTVVPEGLEAGETWTYDDAYAHCYDYAFTNQTQEPISVTVSYQALDANGAVLDTVIDTISAVPANEKFITEAVFKKDIGEIAQVIPEITVNPCGEEVFATDQVQVTTTKTENGEQVEAINHGEESVRVNVHILFFDQETLLQNSWVVPSNTKEYTILPQSTGTEQAVCRAGEYTHVEVYYGALRTQ